MGVTWHEVPKDIQKNRISRFGLWEKEEDKNVLLFRYKDNDGYTIQRLQGSKARVNYCVEILQIATNLRCPQKEKETLFNRAFGECFSILDADREYDTESEEVRQLPNPS